MISLADVSPPLQRSGNIILGSEVQQGNFRSFSPEDVSFLTGNLCNHVTNPVFL